MSTSMMPSVATTEMAMSPFRSVEGGRSVRDRSRSNRSRRRGGRLLMPCGWGCCGY